MTQKAPGASSTAQASGKVKPHGDRAPQHPPPAPWAAAAATAPVPAPRSRSVPPSESETSESTSTSSASSSSSSGASLREYDGAIILDTTSTSSSSAAIEGQRKGRQRRLYSDTMYPAAGRRKRSSSVDTGVGTDEERNSNFCLYSVLAVVLTVITASVIGMSLRAGDSDSDEPHEYILPKQATSRESQCRCDGGSNGTTVEPDAVPDRGSPHTPVNAEAQSTATSLATVSREAGGDTSQPGRPDDAKTVESNDAKTVESNDALKQELAGKVTRAFLAYKIGPGRRRPGAKWSTLRPQEMASAASLKQDDDPGAQTTRTVETRTKPGDQPAWSNAGTETRPTTEQTRREHTSPTAPSSKAVTTTESGDATNWGLGRPLVGAFGAGQRLRAVRRKTPEHPAVRKTARTRRHSSRRNIGDHLATT